MFILCRIENNVRLQHLTPLFSNSFNIVLCVHEHVVDNIVCRNGAIFVSNVIVCFLRVYCCAGVESNIYNTVYKPSWNCCFRNPCKVCHVCNWLFLCENKTHYKLSYSNLIFHRHCHNLANIQHFYVAGWFVPRKNWPLKNGGVHKRLRTGVWGAAKFASGGVGSPCVPTSKPFEIASKIPGWKVVLSSEHGTSKFSCFPPHAENLAPRFHGKEKTVNIVKPVSFDAKIRAGFVVGLNFAQAGEKQRQEIGKASPPQASSRDEEGQDPEEDRVDARRTLWREQGSQGWEESRERIVEIDGQVHPGPTFGRMAGRHSRHQSAQMLFKQELWIGITWHASESASFGRPIMWLDLICLLLTRRRRENLPQLIDQSWWMYGVFVCQFALRFYQRMRPEKGITSLVPRHDVWWFLTNNGLNYRNMNGFFSDSYSMNHQS